MDFSGHWHGYGPWIGTSSLYHTEYLRRPAPFDTRDLKPTRGGSLDPEHYIPFEQRTIPPMFTGHYLLRRPAGLADRTWKDPDSAVDWLTEIYRKHPPAQRANGSAVDCGLEAKAQHARTALAHGTDAVWCYYVTGDRLTSYAVVACPSLPFHPAIPCPLG
ncbi:hypothetical protein [Kitasatospora aureofaciens]|uniref:hypothetical protein n=1 Tax=Kitasatospora aureofaciens TaxID=1894 RepID=UPI000525F4D1|nr:hypothetical protein [Kitasatospora aureofaciens]